MSVTKMALRTEAYPTSMLTAADRVSISTMRAARVTLTTRNYPGQLHIPVSISPCAKASTAANRLGNRTTSLIFKVLNQRMSTNARPPNDNSPPRLTLYSLHRFWLFRRSGSSFHQAPSTAARQCPYEPDHFSCGIHFRFRFRFLDPGRSLYRKFRQRPPSPFRLCLHHACFRRDHSLQVQDRTRSMSATTSSHIHVRSSLQDHTPPLTCPLHSPRTFSPYALILHPVSVSPPPTHCVTRPPFSHGRSPPCTHHTL
jgi:hypothetical protein